jgi:hypothetical protein
MADEEPISTTVTENTSIDTRADEPTLGDLNKEFEDFWSEQDSSAPAAPGDGGAAQETKPEKKEPADAGSTTEEAPKEKELTDEDIDKMGIRPEANPNREQIEDFNKIRRVLKEQRERYQEARAKAAQLEQELNNARQNAWTPEARADYEHAASLRRRFDYASTPEFVEKYQTPIQDKYRVALQRAVSALPDPESAEAWGKHMFERWTPDQLTEDYWEEKVLNQIPEGVKKQKLLAAIGELQELQEARNRDVLKNTETQESFNKWNQERNQTISNRVQEEIMAEIRDREKLIGDYLPRDEESAKTNEERTAIREHNERFNQLNEFFKSQLQDISANGPRGWVRVSIEATRAKILNEEMTQLQKEYKDACSERDKYKAELDKIHGVRRKISNTTGTPPASSQKKDNGLSLKDLGDVRKAFDKFDWGDST